MFTVEKKNMDHFTPLGSQTPPPHPPFPPFQSVTTDTVAWAHPTNAGRELSSTGKGGGRLGR